MNNYEPVLCCLHSMVTFTVTFNFNINYYKYMQVTKNPLKCYFAYKNHNKKIFKENVFLFLHWLEIQTIQVGFALRTNNSMMSAINYSVPWVIIFLLCIIHICCIVYIYNQYGYFCYWILFMLTITQNRVTLAGSNIKIII